MKLLNAFFMGILVAGLMGNLWFLVALAGVAALSIRRTYSVLLVGVVLDIWFAGTGAPWLYIGFFTTLFVLMTIAAEHTRQRLA